MEQFFDIIACSRPILRFCERFDDQSPLWNYTRHSHPYIELLFFLDGKSELEVSGMQLSVSLFDAVAYPAGWKHQEEITPERRREVICLWIDLPELRLPSPIHLHDRDEAIGRLFQMIYGEAKRKRPEPLLLEHPQPAKRLFAQPGHRHDAAQPERGKSYTSERTDPETI